ncbi:DUF4181 domain-containing protein [Planomicrobium sp. MB-3u-38]|uniref:DUF4181 domain-containing protein n=1 Tax=Planomicrobium sp. MB-3u-38 TaxID=2058318 RepID=UPI000C7DFB1D|nr:DUF4181 domain-containing protein [Planomicrobium sp. MB-3u-38]PKH09747.1 hypothetical protein CXF70_13290 [Planomicrobium sp. MB-3u-38]
MYEVEPFFWLKLLLLLTICFLLITIFNAILRRWLGVEKAKVFSHNYVNDKHKKIDWNLRLLFIIMIVLGGFINIVLIPGEAYFFLQPWFLLFGLVFTSEIIRAVMERRYAKNPNAYIFTICQSAFMLVLLIVVFATDFFGIFDSSVLIF